LSSVVEKHVIR